VRRNGAASAAFGIAATLLATSAEAAERPWLRVGLSLANVSRGLSFTDPITPNVRPYEALSFFAPGLRLSVHPLAPLGFAEGLGVWAAYEHTIAATSGSEGQFGTEHDTLQAGLTYRIDVGPLGIAPKLGWHYARFTVGEGAAARVPPTLYSGPRFGLELSLVPIDALELYLGGAFVLVVEAGEVLSSSWYFTGKVNGVIGEAGVRYRFLSMLSVGIEVTYQHFFYDFDPEPTDAFIAGGALDQTVSAALVVGFVWGGES